MNTRSIIHLVVILLLCGSTLQAQENDRAATNNIQSEWVNAVNNSLPLDKFYNDNSGILITGTFSKAEEVANSLKAFIKKNGKLQQYDTLKTFQLRAKQKLVLGKYTTASNKTFYSVIGWRNSDKWIKEFEAIYEHDGIKADGDVAADGRQAWQKYSNEHRPDLIVKNVNAKAGMYFNRGTLSKGDEIATAYGYMNDERYHITLESLSGTLVNEHTFFDIGTFEVGGKGLYLLIWIKENREWKILLDFNF